MIYDLFSGRLIWIQLSGEEIRYCDMSDSHLQNALKMLAKKNRGGGIYLESEFLAREVMKLLASNQGALANWLVSDNQTLRIIAKRALQEKEAEGWEV